MVHVCIGASPFGRPIGAHTIWHHSAVLLMAIEDAHKHLCCLPVLYNLFVRDVRHRSNVQPTLLMLC